MEGLLVGDGTRSIQLLQFANDSLLFCSANSTIVINLQQILYCFKAVLGLKGNYLKSALIRVGIPRLFFDHLATSMGCLVEELSIKYLSYH